jgi:hypothetical protein
LGHGDIEDVGFLVVDWGDVSCERGGDERRGRRTDGINLNVDSGAEDAVPPVDHEDEPSRGEGVAARQGDGDGGDGGDVAEGVGEGGFGEEVGVYSAFLLGGGALDEGLYDGADLLDWVVVSTSKK